MDTRTTRLVRLIDGEARRLERQARSLRRLAAELRDTVEEPDTADTEETEHDAGKD